MNVPSLSLRSLELLKIYWDKKKVSVETKNEQSLGNNSNLREVLTACIMKIAIVNEDMQDVELAILLQASAEKVSLKEFDRAQRLLNMCGCGASQTGNPVQRVVFFFGEALKDKIDRAIGLLAPFHASENQIDMEKPVGTSRSLLESTVESEITELRRDLFEVQSGEVVVVYSCFWLCSLLASPNHLEVFLSVIKNLNPRVIVAIEPEFICEVLCFLSIFIVVSNVEQSPTNVSEPSWNPLDDPLIADQSVSSTTYTIASNASDTYSFSRETIWPPRTLASFIPPFNDFPGLSSEDIQNVELAVLLQASAEKVAVREFERAQMSLKMCCCGGSQTGNPIQRLVFYFGEALKDKIDKEMGLLSPFHASENQLDAEQVLRFHLEDMATIQHNLQFNPISHFTGMQSILDNVATAKKIHLIDLGIQCGTHSTIL
ncbi:hypothetical protein LIER_19790 [Lithospermum erythrorhizon]|uniref:Uncharacterized protein n=1 Tax=Lithospermum erythrorhizon TaxID=34254 RepID=A0AAV3QKK9_LITER